MVFNFWSICFVNVIKIVKLFVLLTFQLDANCQVSCCYRLQNYKCFLPAVIVAVIGGFYVYLTIVPYCSVYLFALDQSLSISIFWFDGLKTNLSHHLGKHIHRLRKQCKQVYLLPFVLVLSYRRPFRIRKTSPSSVYHARLAAWSLIMTTS